MNESLLDAIASARRAVAELEAVETGLLAMALAEALAERAPGSGSDMPVRALATELSAELRMGDRAVQRRLDEAHRVTTSFPTTYESFCAGRISRAHVSVIVGAGLRIDDPDARAAYEEAVVAVAERESAGRLRGIAKLVAERVLPRPLDERHRDAAKARGVWVDDLDDGMSELRAVLPSALAHGIIDRLTRLAKAQRQAERSGADAVGAVVDGDLEGDVVGDIVDLLDDLGHSADAVSSFADDGIATDAAVGGGVGDPADDAASGPTLAQRRADLLADLVLTGAPSTCQGGDGLGAIRAEVLVTVPVLTLAGVADVDGERPSPAVLDGVTPIDPATARRLAGGVAGWDRVLTHPVTGAVLAVDRYRVTADLHRFLRAVDERCRFPCCLRPATHCDIDHLEDAARGGPTADHNLANECKNHHVVKHAAGWVVRRVKGGVVEWTSPSGRVYPDHPPGVVFRPARGRTDRTRGLDQPDATGDPPF